MNGIETVQTIRRYEINQKGGHAIYIAGTTAYDEVYTKNMCIVSGFDVLLFKPLMLDTIISAVKKVEKARYSQVRKKVIEKINKHEEQLIND